MDACFTGRLSIARFPKVNFIGPRNWFFFAKCFESYSWVHLAVWTCLDVTLGISGRV